MTNIMLRGVSGWVDTKLTLYGVTVGGYVSNRAVGVRLVRWRKVETLVVGTSVWHEPWRGQGYVSEKAYPGQSYVAVGLRLKKAGMR